jgi:TolA-binding protein
MSKAPEWIYLDGDAEAGDGMFSRCFEDPKYASDPPIEYGRIDILEAAEQRAYANAIEAARKLHAHRIEELEAENARLQSEVESMQMERLERDRTTLAKLKNDEQ